MNDEDKPVGTSDGRNDELDASEGAVLEALLNLWTPPGDDDEFANAAAALTPKDRRLLEVNRSERQRSQRLKAAFSKLDEISRAEHSTRMLRDSAEETQDSDDGGPIEDAEDTSELMHQLNDCEYVDQFSWQSDYRKKDVIGQGGQGIVYLAECVEEHSVPKALKVYSPRPYRSAKCYHQDMRRMGHVAAKVARIHHDNLLSIERFTSRNGIWVTIMQWIEGYDLSTLLDPTLLEPLKSVVSEKRWNHLTEVVFTPQDTPQLRLTPGMAVNIIEKCLRGLDALHSRGIVHGDIKPSNIMLDRDGSIRLIDIGSAFELSDPPQRHTWTPRYAPPEIFRGGTWTPQSDLASLGYVLIELLCGQSAITTPNIGGTSTRSTRTPCDAALLAEKERLPERLAELLPAKEQESKILMNLCRKLIDPDPSKRFATAEQAMDDELGAHQFLQELAVGRLTTHFCQEIKYWLGDVHRAVSHER